MIFVFLILATLLMMIWLILFYKVNDDDRDTAVNAKMLDIRIALQKQKEKIKAEASILSSYSGIAYRLMKFLYGDGERKITKLSGIIEGLQSGQIQNFDPFTMPGYVLQREIEAIGKSGFRKKILTKCYELYGKKHAGYKASQITAKMLSYPIIGIATAMISGVITLTLGNMLAGYGIIGIGTSLVLVLVYAIYDELLDLAKKRREAISRQFPNVISKLALLVTSGMIMDRAWKETAYSQESEIYTEMRKTSDELDNLVSPEVAFGSFINRCNTKETAKLASAIMQNRSKGNAEIGRLLKDMAHEVWQERRHTAKRDAEKANAKLMIPTMLLFLAILVMLMVPIAMNFSGL